MNLGLKFIIALILSLFVALFAIQNSGTVEISVLFGKYTISQALVIIISAIAGASVVLFLGTIQQVKLNMKLKSSAKNVSKLEEEIKILKAAMPPEAKVEESKPIPTAEMEESNKSEII